MKTAVSNSRRSWRMRWNSRGSAENASALVIVLVLLGLLSVLLVSTGLVVGHLRRELRLIEQQQIKRLHQTSAAASAPAREPATK